MKREKGGAQEQHLGELEAVLKSQLRVEVMNLEAARNQFRGCGTFLQQHSAAVTQTRGRHMVS